MRTLGEKEWFVEAKQTGDKFEPNALAWILRIGVFLMFVGHGAFGMIGKAGWLPYYRVFGINDSFGWKLMPVVGAMDIALGVAALLRPTRLLLAYGLFWTVLTALLRPFAGQGTWQEVFERGGNYGLVLALLFLVGSGSSARSWLERARSRALSDAQRQALSWILRASIALLLVGHGGFGLAHLHDKEWLGYLGLLGISPATAAGLIPVVGWFEIALGLAVLLKPFNALILFVMAWKLGTEFLRPLAGEPIFEFVERAGDYFLPAALLYLQWPVFRSLVNGKEKRMGRFKGRQLVAYLSVLAVAISVLGACGTDKAADPEATKKGAEPNAGTWKTWVLSSASEIKVPAPPKAESAQSQRELAEVKTLGSERTAEIRANVKTFNNPLVTKPWTESAFDFVSQESKNPPLSSRNYALVHLAMYDATVSSFHYKYKYNVEAPKNVKTLVPAGPDPSYPSEHAAIAGAASRVLAHLYPRQSALRLDEMAEQAAESRVQAGVNTRSDITAGLALGRAVAEKVIAYSKTDGADRKWDGSRPAGIGRGPQYWEAPPGAVSPPIEPLAGTWKPWVMTSGDQFRPGPPPAYGSPEFVAAAKEIVDIRKNLTPEQQEIARFYEGGEGTKLPAGIIVNVAAEDVLKAATSDIAVSKFTLPRVVRALALLNVALSDAGIAAWDAKFVYWNPRPINGIRDLGLDPKWEPLLTTPRFPAYPSGSAGYAGAAQNVMTYLFPTNAKEFKRRAEEQAESRLYAGIHWRYDSVSIDAGRKIGDLVVERAKKDGAETS